jgi:hypothetical protein
VCVCAGVCHYSALRPHVLRFWDDFLYSAIHVVSHISLPNLLLLSNFFPQVWCWAQLFRSRDYLLDKIWSVETTIQSTQCLFFQGVAGKLWKRFWIADLTVCPIFEMSHVKAHQPASTASIKQTKFRQFVPWISVIQSQIPVNGNKQTCSKADWQPRWRTERQLH